MTRWTRARYWCSSLVTVVVGRKETRRDTLIMFTRVLHPHFILNCLGPAYSHSGSSGQNPSDPAGPAPSPNSVRPVPHLASRPAAPFHHPTPLPIAGRPSTHLTNSPHTACSSLPIASNKFLTLGSALRYTPWCRHTMLFT